MISKRRWTKTHDWNYKNAFTNPLSTVGLRKRTLRVRTGFANYNMN